ncbi:MAG: alanine/glycine:cation symporter family protein [Phycisphaerales bacterium]
MGGSLLHSIENVNNIIWSDIVLYVVLAVGVLFTLATGVGQIRALTHGTRVIRGVYDRKGDAGAINHFQALSTALSATVGLGNIAGVAIAISLGGPGAVFWMWVVGLIGMALKMTEVTQAMLFRDTSDPENPRGGAMYVCRDGLRRFHPALGPIGAVIGGVFCITLLISAITGGNMFQAWNVADISHAYFGWPHLVSGVVMTLVVGLVIIGGIKRIGDVAGRLVPFMCGLYLLAGLYVVAVNLEAVPAMLGLIFRSAFDTSEAGGAFVGGAAGYAFLKGMQRALFSNEAGQGSAPIAHCAAKTDEPVREGVVAGLEPFIDTLCVCTITALAILLTGTWNRAPVITFAAADGGAAPLVAPAIDPATGAASLTDDGLVRWSIADAPVTGERAKAGAPVFVVVRGPVNPATGGDHRRVTGVIVAESTIADDTDHDAEPADGGVAAPASLRVTFDARTPDEIDAGVPAYAFIAASSESGAAIVGDGAHEDLKGATLTARAFDTARPGLGKWIVPATVWLFAISTIISWSYYGEQAVVYLVGARFVTAYRLLYCLLILVTVQLIETEHDLDTLSTLGTGVMLWANIPIMVIFGPMAMRAYHDYFRRLKSGAMRPAHEAPELGEVVRGDDVD